MGIAHNIVRMQDVRSKVTQNITESRPNDNVRGVWWWLVWAVVSGEEQTVSDESKSDKLSDLFSRNHNNYWWTGFLHDVRTHDMSWKSMVFQWNFRKNNETTTKNDIWIVIAISGNFYFLYTSTFPEKINSHFPFGNFPSLATIFGIYLLNLV